MSEVSTLVCVVSMRTPSNGTYERGSATADGTPELNAINDLSALPLVRPRRVAGPFGIASGCKDTVAVARTSRRAPFRSIYGSRAGAGKEQPSVNS